MGAKDEPWNKCIAKHGQPVFIRQPCLLKIGLHYAAHIIQLSVIDIFIMTRNYEYVTILLIFKIQK